MNNASTLIVTSPYNGDILGDVPVSNPRDIDTALDRARYLYADRRGWLPLHERIGILRRTADIMELHAEELARLAASEGGKPLADSRVEVARAIDGVRGCVDCLRTDAGQVVPMGLDPASAGRAAFTQREPIGVVVAVSAFNHPLNLIVHQVAPAVAAGCPIIVKPAEDTPLSCLRFVDMLREAGLPRDWCRVLVIKEATVAQALVTDPRVGLFSFIGSARVGWMLRSRLAPGTRCLLEHGGIAPVIVCEDADLDGAAARLLKGAYYHSGQVCVSVQRIFVQAALRDALVQRLAAGATALKVGDPLDSSTQVGPLIRAAEHARIASWVSEAQEQGAELVFGGRSLANNCYQPTLLEGVPPGCALFRQEAFGPVATLTSFEDLQDALRLANATPFAFQAAVFTRSIATASEAFAGLDGSTVMVNDHSAFRTDWMPFAGLRQSGLGSGGIGYTLRAMQNDKMLVIAGTAMGAI